MAKSSRNAAGKRSLPNAYGRYSASDQVRGDAFRERARASGGGEDHRGDRSDEVPGTYEGSKGSKDERHPQGTPRGRGTAGTPRRGPDDYPKDAERKG
jgi:hypothetical protein